MSELNSGEAFKIINDLKRGTPPSARLVPHLHVGREPWVNGMVWYLDTTKQHNLSSVRLIVGDPGSGKTHFLRLTAYKALERNFVLCEIALSREVRLDRFDTIWCEMMNKLATADSGGEAEGIESILNRWCSEAIRSPEGIPSLLAKLDNTTNLDPDFRTAMRGYLQAWFTERDRDSYLQWLKGDSVRPPGVRIRISRSNAQAMLRSLLMFLKQLGYAGLVMFLDELELIPEQPNYRIREGAYDILRQFIDNAFCLENFLLLCSMTPKMVSDSQRGIPSYPALWQRVGGMLRDTTRDYRATTISLNHIPLGRDELIGLARRIREIHGIAFDWEPEKWLSDLVLERLAQEALETETAVSPPRYLVELTVRLLEEQQQNPNQSVADLLPALRNQAIESIQKAEQERYRPWAQG